MPAHKSIVLYFCIFGTTFCSIFICFFYLIGARNDIFFDFKIPKTYYLPTLLDQFLIYHGISLNILFYFGNPEFTIAFEIVLLMFPVKTMPHFTVYKYGNFCSEENDIRFT